MNTAVIREVHIACAGITILLFSLRGGLALASIDWRRWSLLRWLPHLNDTILLISAIALAISTSQYPFAESWLTAKVYAVVFYIVFGLQALKPGLTRQQRLPFFVIALASVGYIVLVAHRKNPFPW